MRAAVHAPRETGHATSKVSVDWTGFPFKGIPRYPETRVNVDALEKIVLRHENKLLKQEVDRAKRAIDYLRNGLLHCSVND